MDEMTLCYLAREAGLEETAFYGQPLSIIEEVRTIVFNRGGATISKAVKDILQANGWRVHQQGVGWIISL